MDELSSQLDFSCFYQTYRRPSRCCVPPETLFKIIVYAYINGIYSSRAIEVACRKDINLIWLLNRALPPDYNTIARFRSHHLLTTVQPIFNQLIELLVQHDQIHFQNVFVDGTKIEVNANRYTFVWKKSILKYQKRLLQKQNELIQTICRDYQLNDELPPQNILQQLKSLLKLKQVQW